MEKENNVQNAATTAPQMQQQENIQSQPQVVQPQIIQPQPVPVAQMPQVTPPIPQKKGKKLAVIILSVLLALSLTVTGFFGYMLFLAPDSKFENAEYAEYYSEFNMFDESGLLKVCTGDKWGFIDKSGKIVINPQFDSVSSFSNRDLTCVTVGEKYGYINKKGEYVINPQFDYAYPFYGDLALVKSGGKYGYIDKSGKFVINPQFDEADSFYESSDNIARVCVDEKYGYINTKGEYIVNPQYASADYFSNGLAAVKSGDKWGYINTKGDTVISYQYARAYTMSDDGYAIVMTTNKNLIIIDKNGNAVTSGEFDSIDYENNEDICQKDGCYNYASDTYCEEHEEKTDSDYDYCKYYGCLNKAYVGEYCTDHNYLEEYY